MLVSDKLDLRSFITSYLERAGAVVEEAGYEVVEALLPDELASHFGEHIMLAFDYEAAQENPSAAFITYGSPLLDTAARLAAGYGRYTVLYCPKQGFSQSRRFDQEIAEKIKFLRCRPPRIVYQWVADHVFWCFYFHAAYCSHEKVEELLTVVMDGFTGLPSPDFFKWWDKVVPANEPQYQILQAECLPVPVLYEAACREAKKLAEERALAMQGQVNLQVAREMSKVNSYYNQTLRDIEKKMAATEDAAKKERLARQMSAIHADWRRREKDILERYAMEAELRLDHLVACHLPRVHIKLEVQHKDRLLNTTLLYNLPAGCLELPICPLCRKSTAHLVPDRENRLVCVNHS